VASGDRSLNRPVAAHLKADDASSRKFVKKKKSESEKKSEKKVEKLYGFNACPLFS
jgi:hypothetical protein